MAARFSRQQKTSGPRRRKPQHDPYTSKIVKPPTKLELEQSLRHAVRNHDADALEDHDENLLRPPTNAVTNPYIAEEDPELRALDYDWYDWDDSNEWN